MTNEELIQALDCLKVQTGSLACLGCGYEHNCSTKGCRILREAAEQLCRGSCSEKRGEGMNLRDLPIGATVIVGDLGAYKVEYKIDGMVCLKPYPTREEQKDNE